MSRADLIPLSLLRDLAARMPDPIRPASFVDLAVYVSRSAPALAAPAPTTAPSAEAAPAPAITAPAADVAPAPVAIDKKGLPWTLEELQQARALLNGGKGPSEVARILGRPVAATQITIKRYGVRGTGPITVPGRPKGRFKKANPADAPAPAHKAKAAKPAPARKPKTSTEAKVSPPVKAKANPTPPLAKPTPAVAPPGASAPASKPVTAPEPTPQDADPKQARIRATLQAAIAENQPGRQIRVLSHLLTLPHGSFTPADDLFLAEGLASRRALAEIADQLGCESSDIMKRWKAMLFADLTDRHGHILLDGQADLLRALRWLAGREGQPGA